MGITKKGSFFQENGKVYYEDEFGEIFEQEVIQKSKPVGNDFNRTISNNQDHYIRIVMEDIEREASIKKKCEELRGSSTMSDKEKKTAIQRLVDSNLQKTDLMLLLYLIGIADYGNYVKMSQKEIAEKLNKKQPHISRSIKKLREYGFLSTQYKGIRLHLDLAWKGHGYKHKMEKAMEEMESKAGVNIPDNNSLA
ncbi:helix-turn-helix domain-containing protein [Halomonas sp. KM-1]|uniref:helix-turn-helix domain-containing protein n=1 Tax=Halomonas sp. KM-1 TaxID=590061 RepID=UPI000287A4DD|nr:helix-turn-helix domain-containing protein [Halomonas sp. KM-1]